MATEIEQDALVVLRTFAQAARDQYIRAEDLSKMTGLSPNRLRDAVAFLVNKSFADWVQTFGTAPYEFLEAAITSRGRYEAQVSAEVTPPADRVVSIYNNALNRKQLPHSPAGSPFGFTEDDWGIVAERKEQPNRLYAVLGHQFVSTYYDSAVLGKNIKSMLEQAVETYNAGRSGGALELEYTVLSAGYGEHVFNEIARDIISADVAVFETSDLNPNVMLEMGVALTWGVRVLPIKAEGRPIPPSDVSGQTWADYCNSAGEFVDHEHQNKLVKLIDRALRKKVRPGA